MVTVLRISRRQPARWLFACLTGEGVVEVPDAEPFSPAGSVVLSTIRDLDSMSNQSAAVEGGQR